MTFAMPALSKRGPLIVLHQALAETLVSIQDCRDALF